MAQQILANVTSRQIIDQSVLDELAADIVADLHPGIEDRPKVFFAYTAATAVLIRPPLEALVNSYRMACKTPCGREAANHFLENLLSAEA